MLKVLMSYQSGAYMPRPRVRLRKGEMISPQVTALVDSGAAITMAVMDLAEKVGLEPAALRRNKPTPVGGISGSVNAYRAEIDLLLGAKDEPGAFEVPSVLVYFVDAPTMPFAAHVLLGQSGALRKLLFWQRNQDEPKPYFGLKLL